MSSRVEIEAKMTELQAKNALLTAQDPFTKEVMKMLNEVNLKIVTHSGKFFCHDYGTEAVPMPHKSPYPSWDDDKGNKWLAFDHHMECGYVCGEPIPVIWKRANEIVANHKFEFIAMHIDQNTATVSLKGGIANPSCIVDGLEYSGKLWCSGTISSNSREITLDAFKKLQGESDLIDNIIELLESQS